MTEPRLPFDQRTCTAQERDAFLVIQRAVLEAAPRSIRFTYTKEDGSTSDRHAEPYEVLGGAGGAAQLVAWDIDKQATRRFFLERMSAVEMDLPFNARFPIKIPL